MHGNELFQQSPTLGTNGLKTFLISKIKQKQKQNNNNKKNNILFLNAMNKDKKKTKTKNKKHQKITQKSPKRQMIKPKSITTLPIDLCFHIMSYQDKFKYLPKSKRLFSTLPLQKVLHHKYEVFRHSFRTFVIIFLKIKHTRKYYKIEIHTIGTSFVCLYGCKRKRTFVSSPNFTEWNKLR